MRGIREDFDEANAVVKQETFEFEGKSYRASTVDLGINHNHWGGTPLYFETMIFPDGLWGEVYGYRYTTREEALNGHEKLIEDILKGKYELRGGWFVLKDIDSTAPHSEAEAESDQGGSHGTSNNNA